MHPIFQCSDVYLQVTFTFTWWSTGFPNPLWALQRYVPASVLLMFRKSQVGPWCSTSLLLLSSSTLVQVMFGIGLPVASQNKAMFDPSSTVWSRLTLISLAGTVKKGKRQSHILKLKQVVLLFQVFYKTPFLEFLRGVWSRGVLEWGVPALLKHRNRISAWRQSKCEFTRKSDGSRGAKKRGGWGKFLL